MSGPMTVNPMMTGSDGRDGNPGQDDAPVDFREAMKGVRPLAPTTPIPVRQPRKPTAVQLARRAAALGTGDAEALPVSVHIPTRAPAEVLMYRGVGVQQNVFRRLRLGQMTPEATIDLHGMRLEEASRELPAFIREAVARGCRVVRVVHGKGGRADAQDAPMKSQVAQWLSDMEAVLAYHSTLPHDGGTGALYVLLRRDRSLEESPPR